MKTRRKILFKFVLFANVSSTFSQNQMDTCVITYVANEGCLIKTTNHKVLVDAIFSRN